MSFEKARKRKAAWARGVLSWKLHTTQVEMYEAIKASCGKKFVINCSRRIGKTYLMVNLALETALRKKNARVRFAAPTGDALEDIVLPIFTEILKDCPRSIRPTYKTHKKRYDFPNGSQIKLSGVDKGHHNRLRGPRADLCLVDEAGFMDCLPELVKDVLMPQLMYNNDGKIIIASTPSDSPGHPFRDYCSEAEAGSYFIHRTIWDNPRLTLDEILEFAEEAGCEVDWNTKTITKQSTSWRREYLGEHVTESERAVIPEFSEEKAKAIIQPWERPEFCHKWVFIDTGFIDFTGVLFAYYDFKAAKIVFEDELLIDFKKEGANVDILKERILTKEKELWEDERPYHRFADGDLIVLAELSTRGLPVTPVRKDHLEAQVNAARIDVANESLIIHPRCKNTIAHYKYAIWDKQRKKFERTEGHGHYDLLACGIYAHRHINRSINPWPILLGVDKQKSFIPKNIERTKTEDTLRRIFNR